MNVRPAPPVVPAPLIAALRDHLDAEIAVMRRLLAASETKQKAIIAGDRPGLERALADERAPNDDAARLRKVRDRLLAGLATTLGLPAAGLTLTRILAALPSADRQGLTSRQADLIGVLERLRACNERNLLLIRHSLGFVHDLLGVLLGQPAGEPSYDQRGTAGSPSERGRLVDIAG